MLALLCSIGWFSLASCTAAAPTTHLFTGSDADIAQLVVPVAIANLSEDNYLIADYEHVFLFNRKTGGLKRLVVDMGGINSKFVPTSFAVDSANHRVFVANYLGNNILLCDIDIERGIIRIESEIKDEQTISPEGVAYDGAILATANFDGGTVRVFQRSGESWSARCAASVPQAHGVGFHSRYIYATSITDRQVVQIDPQTCNVVKRTGSVGWQAGQYLWPTAVATWDEKSIVVSDAQTGLLSILDAETLSVTRQIGGNGPGINGLNMPYNVFVEADVALVTNTFGSRISAFEKSSGAMIDIWSSRPVWQGPGDFRRAALTAQHREGYIRTSVSVDIGGECYHPEYARLARCDDPAKVIKIGPVYGIFLYMVEALRTKHGVLVFSPSAPWAQYFDDADPKNPSSKRIGRDHWIVDNRIVGPDGVLDVENILAQ